MFTREAAMRIKWWMVVGGLFAFFFVRSLPDLVRYVKIERM